MSLKRLVAGMFVLLAFSVPTLLSGQTPSRTLAGTEVVELASPSVALVLFGESGGTQGYATAVVVRSDGVLLTAYHAVKNAREVQVRLKNGEVFDRVELIAFDERRDVAALRIAASGLAAVPIASLPDARAGLPVYVISHAAGLTWSASAGIVSGVRMAEDIPGAGSGYRVVQFTAPISPGSSGGVLVDAQGRALGIVVGILTGGQNLNFAVPLESVAGLAAASGGTPFASGNRLQLPSAAAAVPAGTPGRSPAVAPPASPDLPRPDQLLIRTVSVLSKTIHIRRERLQDDLQKTSLFRQLGVRFADYGETADVSITVDRPFLTFDWTYTLVYQPSGLTLASGMIEGVDEFDAGPNLAAQIMEQLAAAAVLPRAALAATRMAPAARDTEAVRRSPSDPAELLRTLRAIFVESHTIWMKGNLLQDALYVRPELREWGIRVADDRNAADVYIDVTRPFLTYDWVYKMISTRTGTVLGTGKVVAIDGSAAAQRLAIEIVKRIQTARPLPASEPQRAR